MKPKLYQYTACPFCCKVRALLDYKKVPYEAIEVHPLNKKEIEFSKDYKKVPIFVDEQGVQINDSSKIMRYIDRFYPDHPVFEKESKSQDIENLWMNWSDEKLAKALPPLIYETWSSAYKAFRYVSSVSAFSFMQKLGIRFSGTIAMKLVAKRLAKRLSITNPKQHLKGLLKDFEEAIDGRHFLGRGRPNGADLAIFGILSCIETLPTFTLIKENPAVFSWYQRVQLEISRKAKQATS